MSAVELYMFVALTVCVVALYRERANHRRTRVERDAARADAERWMAICERTNDHSTQGGH